MSENTALATLNKATAALAKAEKPADISAIRSHAKVFQLHAKEFRLGREALLEGARVQLLAELKLGDIAKKQAKSEGFGEMLESARLSSGQVHRWGRELSRVTDEIDSDDDSYKAITSAVNKYIDSIRQNPDFSNMDMLPSFRGFLGFIAGKDHEEANKEPRTEAAKLYCKYKPFKEAEKEVAKWLEEPGRSAQEKSEIKKMWAVVQEQGNLFKGQRAEETGE